MSKKKKFIIAAALVLALVGICTAYVLITLSESTASEISIEEAQKLVNEEFDAMAPKTALSSVYVAEYNSIKVNDISYGNEKDIILDCTVDTYDVYSAVSPYFDEFISAEVKRSNRDKDYKTALDFMMEFTPRMYELVKSAKEQKGVECTIVLYEVEGNTVLYADPQVVDCVYGGIVRLTDEFSKIKQFTVTDEDGSELIKNVETNNISDGFRDCLHLRYEDDKPDTAVWFIRLWNGLKHDFYRNFIEHDRWLTIVNGLWTTIRLTLFSLVIGVVLGFLVAFTRCTYDKQSKPNFLLKLLNGICKVYLTVIRGTPAIVQITIIYFVIFMPIGVDKFLAAVICFGINSGAYVAEIVRGGIMSVDDGQTEAGRSLGFGYMPTMAYVVFPQAFKAVLPALANEFVVLLKETSIAFYIGIGDLMYAGNAIRAATYSPFMPLITVAIVYLIMVVILSKLVSILERKLRNNER